jgi:hypothetical protein
MSNDTLVAVAKGYKKSPFNHWPKTADALTAELKKRGLEEEAESFVLVLQGIDWYGKPWIKF